MFGISNNNICISLKNFDWLPQFLKKHESPSAGIKLFQCDGNDVFDVYKTSQLAFNYSRSYFRPAILVYNNLVRRFGHAATDRQSAYYSKSEIEQCANSNALLTACEAAVALNILTFDELLTLFQQLQSNVECAFDKAVNEGKITDVSLLESQNSAAMYVNMNSTNAISSAHNTRSLNPIRPITHHTSDSKDSKEAMRKHMTRVYDEILSNNADVVYIGITSVCICVYVAGWIYNV